MDVRSITVIMLIALCKCASAYAEGVLLGVLEEVPGVHAGESNSTEVRALFRHDKNGWKAFKSECATQACLMTATAQYPKEVTWFVGFDGHKIGRVVARTPNTFPFYSHIGLQDIVDGMPPVVGKSSYENAGFAEGVVHRPLVTNSRPNFMDPALWKREAVTGALTKRVIALLHSLVPPICKEGASEDAPLVPFNYALNDLVVRTYRSANGRLLITANVSGAYYCNYDGAGDGGLDSQTFAVDPGGKARLLGHGLSLVDAGDYDLDGKSELVFVLSQYNRGGYVLFSDDFVEQARFEFSYH